MSGEGTAHRIGHEGLHEIKEWLEATTRFAFSFTVWDREPMCTRECPDGTKKAGYVTPEDEHHGRGEAIRKARRDGLAQARRHPPRLRQNQPETTSPDEDN